jgi:hypothetical protein
MIVSTQHPFTESAISGQIPSLPGKSASGTINGAIAQAPGTATDPASVHFGVFSDGLDLAASPVIQSYNNNFPSSCLGSSDPLCLWVSQNTTVPHASTLDYPTVLTQALGDVESELSKLGTGRLQTALDVFSSLGAQTTVGDPEQKFLGYTPEYGRWLRQLATGGGAINYSDPLIMTNLRERGARLYCAAREAQNLQSSSTVSMGKLTAFPVSLFGQKIDFMTVEPTVVLDGPLPYLGGPPRCPVGQPCNCAPPQNCFNGSPNDGAQAFMIPFLVGTQITPVSFLPSLPEIRVPVVMVTGDSEIVTPALIPHQFPVTETYQTVTHSNAILSSEVTGAAGTSILIFSAGPISVFVDLGMAYGVGQLFSSEQIQPPTTGSSFSLPTPPKNLPDPNDRLLASPPSGWPATRWASPNTSFGDVTPSGLDAGPWLSSPFLTANTMAAQTVFAEPTNSGPVGFVLQPSNPFLLRGLEDDDRGIWNSTTLGLSGGVRGVLGADVSLGLGELDVNLSAGGQLLGSVAMRHTLREAALFLQQSRFNNQQGPISEVSIIPSVSANASLNLFVHLKIQLRVSLPFPVGDITVTIFDNDLVSTNPPISLANYNSGPWAEANRFRLGTGSAVGDPLKAPVVSSHFPNSNGSPNFFASFPAGNDVDSCLASSTPNTPAPPACPSQPATSTAPQEQICIYAGGPLVNGPAVGGFSSLPPNVCANVTGYASSVVGLSSAQRQCLIDKLNFLCQPVSQEQPFNGATVLARIMDFTNTAEKAAFSSIATECIQAYPPQQAATIAKQLFGFALCSSNASLISPSQAVTAGGPPSVGPGSCQGSVGAGELTPKDGSSEVGEPATFELTWTVPKGQTWRDLKYLDLKLDDKGFIGLWARFLPGNPSAFALLNNQGQIVAEGAAGNAGVLDSPTATLDLANISFQAAEPTSPTVTAKFVVSFKPAAAGDASAEAARVYDTFISAANLAGTVQGPEKKGHWTVRLDHDHQ